MAVLSQEWNLSHYILTLSPCHERAGGTHGGRNQVGTKKVWSVVSHIFFSASTQLPMHLQPRPPAQLMFGRELMCALHATHPNRKNSGQKERPQGDTKAFIRNQRVVMRNFLGKPDCMRMTVIRHLGLRSYLVRTSDSKIRCRHVDHLLDFDVVPPLERAEQISATHAVPLPAVPALFSYGRASEDGRQDVNTVADASRGTRLRRPHLVTKIVLYQKGGVCHISLVLGRGR